MFYFRTWFFILLFLFGSSSFATPPHDVYVVHFVLDGLRTDVLNRFVAEGELPNLKEYFVDRGAIFSKTLTTFPSVSSPGYIAFATGLGAGNSGIFFLEWFDRTRGIPVGYLTLKGVNRVNTDLLNRIALMDPKETKLYPPMTLFEKLAPMPTAAVYTPFRRGASLGYPQKIPFAGIVNSLLTRDGLELDRLAMQNVYHAFSMPLSKVPRYTLVGLYGIDYYAHEEGLSSRDVLAALKQFDLAFKKFLDQLARRGLRDKTYIILSSDHGMHPTGKVFALGDILWRAGVRDKSVYAGNRGVSSTFLYAKGEKGWRDLPSLERLRHFPAGGKKIDLIQILLEREETGWLAVRDGLDTVRVFKTGGEGVIRTIPGEKGSFYSYAHAGKDPFGFAQNPGPAPFSNGDVFSREEWLRATSDAATPNAIVEIADLFQEPRVGDMLIVTKGPWVFRKEKGGTHGSLNRADMQIPLWIGGPDIPRKVFDGARGVDLFPTILTWFGLGAETYEDQDGRPLFTPQKERDDTVDRWLARMEKSFPEVVSYPASLRKGLREKCRSLEQWRRAQLTKLETFRQKAAAPENPLGIPKSMRQVLQWRFAYEEAEQRQRVGRLRGVARFLENQRGE